MGAIRFASNGWRARIGEGYDESSVVRIAQALGATWATRYEGSTVVVGYDVRRDAKRFALAVGQVIAAHGLRVVVSDAACPTPALKWTVAHDPLCIGGVMLTASRMPHEYGGLQVCQHDGGPVSTSFAAAVSQRIEAEPADARGPVEYADIVTPYCDALVSEADANLIASAGLRVVVDPLYGAASGSATKVFARLGCDVIPLHDKQVSDFRKLHPDAREPWVDECERMVVQNRADMGVVIDGDASRVAIIEEAGRLVSPHDLAPLILEHVVAQRGQRGRVVGTVATSARIARQAQRLGCDYSVAPVGIESLYREFYEGDVVLATDESGSLIVPSHIPERDGLCGAVMLLELVAGSGERVTELVKRLEDSLGRREYAARDIRLDFGATQRLRNLLPGLNPHEVNGIEPIAVSHLDGLRLSFPNDAWLLLRASRSGSGARVAAEAPTAHEARALVAAAADLIQ